MGDSTQMTLMDLKKQIEKRELFGSFFVFICPQNFFVANQYAEAICDILQLEKTYATSIFEEQTALSLVMNFENNFKVIHTDVFNEVCEDYSGINNTAVICQKVDKKLEKVLEPYTYIVPELLDWQIKDYMRHYCPELTLNGQLVDSDIDKLYKWAHGDIYKIINELDKVNLFVPEDRTLIFAEMLMDPAVSFETFDAFKFKDSVFREKHEHIAKYFAHREVCNIEPLSLVGLLQSELKNRVFIEGDCKKMPEEIGLSARQVAGIKSNPSNFSLQTLQNKLSFITSIDLRLKSGLLDMTPEQQMDYILLRMVT